MKGISKARLVLALLAIVLALLPTAAMAESAEIVDGDATLSSASHQRMAFVAGGREWVLYRDYAAPLHWRMRSTDDFGATWSAEIDMGDKATGNGVSISCYYDGTYAHFVRTAADGWDNWAYYRSGTPNSDGTITWNSSWTCFYSDSSQYYGLWNVHICVDGLGYPWVAAVRYHYTSYANYEIYVYKSSKNDGTWATEAGFPDLITTYTSPSAGTCDIQPLLGGKVVVFYARSDGNSLIRAVRWTGTEWGTEATTTELCTYAQWSTVAKDDEVFTAFVKSSPYDILFTTYSASTNSFSAETTLYDGTLADDDDGVIISRSSDTDDLDVWWKHDPSSDTIYTMHYDYSEGAWVEYETLYNDVADGITTSGTQMTAPATPPSSHVRIYYIDGDDDNLKTVWSGQPLIVQTLTPDPIGETMATLRGQITSIGKGCITERGFEYREYGGATDSLSESGAFGLGGFTGSLDGLSSDSLYECRAYGVDGEDTVYGNWTSFMTQYDDYTSPWAPGGNDTLIAVPTPPPGWHRPSPSTGAIEGTLIGGLLNPFFESSGFPVEFVWWVIFAILCNLVCILSFALGRHTFMVFVAGSLVIGSMCALGIIDWWLIFVYIVFGLSLLVNERQIAV